MVAHESLTQLLSVCESAGYPDLSRFLAAATRLFDGSLVYTSPSRLSSTRSFIPVARHYVAGSLSLPKMKNGDAWTGHDPGHAFSLTGRPRRISHVRHHCFARAGWIPAVAKGARGPLIQELCPGAAPSLLSSQSRPASIGLGVRGNIKDTLQSCASGIIIKKRPEQRAFHADC